MKASKQVFQFKIFFFSIKVMRGSWKNTLMMLLLFKMRLEILFLYLELQLLDD